MGGGGPVKKVTLYSYLPRVLVTPMTEMRAEAWTREWPWDRAREGR